MKRRGMGLVEMVVAMIVLATAGLAVTSTMAVLSGKGVRRAGYSSLDLQALSYARAQLESLRDAVSTDATRSAPLVVSATSYDTTSSLPSDFTSSPVNGTRTYLVSSVGTSDLKQVKVTVQWTDV